MNAVCVVWTWCLLIKGCFMKSYNILEFVEGKVQTDTYLLVSKKKEIFRK